MFPDEARMTDHGLADTTNHVKGRVTKKRTDVQSCVACNTGFDRLARDGTTASPARYSDGSTDFRRNHDDHCTACWEGFYGHPERLDPPPARDDGVSRGKRRKKGR
jgi:hypothetical protein